MAEANYIPRRLVWTDDQFRRFSIGEDELTRQGGPVVVLGEPGSGKSELFRQVASVSGAPLVTAEKWLRTTKPERLIQPNRPILIDGLDEASARRDGDAIQRVLEKLDAVGNPNFILSCRSADWEARAITSIREDYAIPPLVCHIQPFTTEEARRLIEKICPHHEPDDILKRLGAKGLGDLAGSPLTLQLVGAVIAAQGDLPGTRAKLYEMAANALWSEHNPDRSDIPLADMTEQEALDCVGAACAALLMSGRASIALTGPAHAGADALSVKEIALLLGGANARAVLASKLFRFDEPGRVIPFHRTVAEYLGARWVARQVNARTSARLMARLQPNGSVPARVRGLHAWLAHFDQVLGKAAMRCDPFGVVRYGDVDGLPLDGARYLLASLVSLAGRDPYFRAGDFSSYTLGALMRPELASDIDSLIGSADTNGHLRTLLIEGLHGQSLAVDLAPTLERIARDPERFYRERDDAIEALAAHRDISWKLALIEELRRQATEDSSRLAVSMLGMTDLGAVDVRLIASVVCTDMGLTMCALPRDRERHTLRSYHRIMDAVPQGSVPDLLDAFAGYAFLASSGADYPVLSEFVMVIAYLAARVLPTLLLEEAARAWAWLRPLRGTDHYDREMTRPVVDILIARTDLRRAMQQHIAFIEPPRPEFVGVLYADLHRTPGLAPRDEDLDEMLQSLANADRQDARLRHDWQQLTEQMRSPDTLPGPMVEIARSFAGDDPELLSHLERVQQPPAPRTPSEWELEYAAEEAERSARRAERFANHRAEFAEHREQLRAGEQKEIARVAQAYLGRYNDIHADTPVGPLETWLGPDLAADALTGLEAVLYRPDLPDLREVSASLAQGRACHFGLAALAAVMERLRHGKTLSDISQHALRLALLHRAFCWHADNRGSESIQQSLKDAVTLSAENFETWHRIRIEPQLELLKAQVTDLGELTHETRFAEIAQRLCREWLIDRPHLPHDVEHELVDTLLFAGDWDTVREISSRRSSQILPDRDCALYWVAADWVTDFAASASILAGIGKTSPEFLHILRERLGHDRRQPRHGLLSIDQRAWVVAEFRSAWPLVDHFTPGAEHDSVEATDMIRAFINSLASDPHPEAGATLDALGLPPPDSYTDTILHAAAEQRQLRSETEFKPVPPAELRDLLLDGPPSDIDELRALVLAELDLAQSKLRGNDTDRLVEFWTDDGIPREENRCRDRLADLIEPGLQSYRVDRIPERDMPMGKRVDLAFARGTMQLPLEVKGQWHDDVWNAASDQLDHLYLRDWRSGDRGIYVVLWFGEISSASGRRLQVPPSGPTPTSPEEMEDMLRDRLPPARRGAIEIRVIDLSR